MKNILFAWIGKQDQEATKNSSESWIGPIARAVTTQNYEIIVLLCNYGEKDGKNYKNWLQKKFQIDHVKLKFISLTSPTAYDEIYRFAADAIQQVQKEFSDNARLTFHLSPGTSAMAAVWIILSKTKFPANLIESSIHHGVKQVSIPFDIAADYIPPKLQVSDQKVVQLTSGFNADKQAFKDIEYRSEIMRRVVAKARLVAIRSVPVLIEGESGTGKEMFARAIHAGSDRANKPFIPINCGAIPAELIETELFGHEKGAFTGADKKRPGHFKTADTGTLFLDEIGELPSNMQVKLLRVLQEGKIKQVGKDEETKIDVRIIAATNRNLVQEIANGKFREDLFYRLAVGVLSLPPLRKREGDISLLTDIFLQRINEETKGKNHDGGKKISASAKNIIINYSWPGNIRELLNTLTRAHIWSLNTTINEEDIRDALLPVYTRDRDSDGLLGKPVCHGVDLTAIMRTVAAHYLAEALKETHGNKTQAARLLKLSSHQTLSNWLEKYGVK